MNDLSTQQPSSTAHPPKDRIANNFTYHPPKQGQVERYQMLRDEGAVLARLIVDHTPASREQAIALTNLEQAIMWANAAIARNE